MRLQLVMLSLSKHTPFRARDHTLQLRFEMHSPVLRVMCENLPRHTEPALRIRRPAEQAGAKQRDERSRSISSVVAEKVYHNGHNGVSRRTQHVHINPIPRRDRCEYYAVTAVVLAAPALSLQ